MQKMTHPTRASAIWAAKPFTSKTVDPFVPLPGRHLTGLGELRIGPNAIAEQDPVLVVDEHPVLASVIQEVRRGPSARPGPATLLSAASRADAVASQTAEQMNKRREGVQRPAAHGPTLSERRPKCTAEWLGRPESRGPTRIPPGAPAAPCGGALSS